MAIVRPQYKQAPEYGEYRIALGSGAVIGISAANPVFSLQWTSTSLAMVVKRVNFFWTITTAFGAAQNVAYGLYVARSYTVADTGGTTSTLTTNNAKLKTSFPTTSVADMRIATTGTLTAGTRTLDAHPLAIKSGGSNTLGLGTFDPVNREFGILDATNPIILLQDEGLVLANLVNYGATGVTTVYVELEWSEVATSKV
ncbi:MAG: hypothetical protein WAP47_02035 [Candidatus Rokuibacteriota bacterium]